MDNYCARLTPRVIQIVPKPKVFTLILEFDFIINNQIQGSGDSYKFKVSYWSEVQIRNASSAAYREAACRAAWQAVLKCCYAAF